MQGLYAVARTAAVESALSRQIPTVPTLAWRNSRDIERQVHWLKVDSADVPVIAIDIGTRSADQFEWILQGIRITASILDRPQSCRLVAHGTANTGRIERLARTWPGQLTIASSHPAHSALRGKVLDSALAAVPACDLTLSECAEVNINVFGQVVQLILRTTRPNEPVAA
jgi:hypothetical protein